MAYSRNPTWQDAPSTATPIGAAQLEHIEAGIEAAASVADSAAAGLSGKADVGHVHDDRYYTESEVDSLIAGIPTGGAGGVTDHGNLSGLADDDHPQYHNDARGDARYAALHQTPTSTVFDGTVDFGSNAFRIPWMCQTNNGTIVAGSDIRYGGDSDFGRIDIGSARSTDGGRTWTNKQVAIANNNIDPAYSRVMDGTVIHDSSTDRIFLFGVKLDDNISWGSKTSTAGWDCVYVTSNDAGLTWSAPTSVAAAGGGRPFMQGVGSGIRMGNGTLVLPIQYSPAASRISCTILYSTNGGTTWTRATGLAGTDPYYLNECNVVEYETGKLLLNCRTNGPDVRRLFTSADMGATWTEITHDLPAQPNECMGSTIKVTLPNGKVRLLYSSTHQSDRSNVQVWQSRNSGANWTLLGSAWAGAAKGYSCLTYRHGELHDLIEVGGDIYFRDISWMLPIIESDAPNGGGGAVTSVDGQTGVVDLSGSYAARNRLTTVTLTSAGQAVTLPTSPQNGDEAFVLAIQDATGGRTAAWPSGVIWPAGVTPTLATAAGARDLLCFVRAGTEWLGRLVGSFPAPYIDTTAPSVPAGLSATTTGTTTVSLSWTASTDDLATTGYEYRVDGGSAVDAGIGTTKIVTGLAPSTSYTFEVRAFDAAGNRSGWSTSASATTTESLGDWTPSSLTSLAAWVDASDTATITATSGTVALVTDKHAGLTFSSATGTEPTTGASTLNGLNVLTFAGDFLTSTAASSTWKFLHDSTGATIVAVAKFGTSADPNAIYGLLGTAAASGSTIGLNFGYEDRATQSANDAIYLGGTRGTTSNYTFHTLSSGTTMSNAAKNIVTPNTPHLVSAKVDPANATVASRLNLRIDGALTGIPNQWTGTTGAPSTSNPTNTLQIGAMGNGVVPMTGYIAELVIASGTLTDTDRQKTEGYLAHKWGLTANLPAGHPYKSVAP